MSDSMPFTLAVNGERHEILVKPWHTLLHVLRDQLLMTGTKRGCNQGVCGACTVLVDGEAARGCLSLAVNCTGREITTIEGVAQNGVMSRVQQGFHDTAAVQCGFCTSGMVMAATALLEKNAAPSVNEIREGLSGNLCRCSGYVKIVEAVRLASGANEP